MGYCPGLVSASAQSTLEAELALQKAMSDGARSVFDNFYGVNADQNNGINLVTCAYCKSQYHRTVTRCPSCGAPRR